MTGTRTERQKLARRSRSWRENSVNAATNYALSAAITSSVILARVMGADGGMSMSVMDIVRLLFLAIETPLLVVLIVYIIKIERLRK